MDQQQQRSHRGAGTARSRWLIGVAAAMLLAACGGGHGGGDELAEELPPVVVPAPPEVSVAVSSSGSAALEGVLVEVVGSAATATTAADGSARIVLADTRPLVLRLSKAGYTDTFKTAAFGTGVTAARVRASLLPRADAQSLDASVGGRLQGRQGAVVELPAGALVDAVTGAPVSGAVDIAMTPVDVGGDAIRAFPGLFSGVDMAGQRRSIASYGTTEFALTQAGRRLNLAPGQTATIELPIFTPFHAPGVPVAVGDTIPLWSLDETTGVWKQEGSGTVVASADSPTGLAMRATVGHFSWWNCDVSVELGKICLRISMPDVADKDRVNPDDPKVVGDINADPNLYRLGTARMVSIDGRTADDRLLRQAGIDFKAAFSDDAFLCPPQQLAARAAQQSGTGRPLPAGVVYDVTSDLSVPADRTSSLTACAQVQRNGAQFAPEMACGTVFVAPHENQTVATTVALAIAPAADTDFPQITSQPSTASVEVGQAATFSVSASRAVNGDAPVTYQWTRNGTAIGGATAAAYTTPATTLADNGSLYAVIVSAPAGTTLSYPARLTVAVPPPPPPPPNSGTDRWVDATAGNDGNDGSAAAPLKTISAAIAVVKSGGTIWLADGTWTQGVDPALSPSSQGLNCTASTRSPLVTGTTIRAVNPGRATIRYASAAGICVGDTQVRDLRLEVETILNTTVAIAGTGPGASLLSGTSVSGGSILAAAGARVTMEPGPLASYGDPGDLSGRAVIVTGAGSEVIVNGGRFDRLSSVPFSGTSPGPSCAQGASLYATSGGRLVLNQVDLAPGPARSSAAKYDVAIGACSGARLELNGSTVAGFVRGGLTDSGLAVSVANGSTLLVSANSALTGNQTGISMRNATATLDGGATVGGSLASGIIVNGSSGPSTLSLRGGSGVSGGAAHGIDVRGATATPPNIDIADATLAGNAGAGLYAQSATICRMRGTQATGNGSGVQLHSGAGCDLGTAASAGGNRFANVGTGVFASGSSSTVYLIQAVGNTWSPNQQGADAQGRYAVPGGQPALDVGVLNPPGLNYRVDNLKATLRLAE